MQRFWWQVGDDNCCGLLVPLPASGNEVFRLLGVRYEGIWSDDVCEFQVKLLSAPFFQLGVFVARRVILEKNFSNLLIGGCNLLKIVPAESKGEARAAGGKIGRK